MEKVELNHQSIMFVIMVIVGVLFNPMNILAYRFSDLYLSYTLFYGGLLMASNMMWSHEVVHYLSMGHFNKYVFLFGLVLSIGISVLLLRGQFGVDEKQWLRRMISHHSTALTTSINIYSKSKDEEIKALAKTIIDTQEKEIEEMKEMLKGVKKS